MKLNPEKSSMVRKVDRDYLDQVDLHSSAEQEDYNEQLASLTKTQINLIAQRFKNRKREPDSE